MGVRGDGAVPRLWRLRAEWIPAYAGMTVRGRMAAYGCEIPAYAGMTVEGREWRHKGTGATAQGSAGGTRQARWMKPALRRHLALTFTHNSK